MGENGELGGFFVDTVLILLLLVFTSSSLVRFLPSLSFLYPLHYFFSFFYLRRPAY